jgi:RNA polymerase sigma-70 factor (ECF subfamily)
MEGKRQSRSGRQIREECAEDQAPSWPPGRYSDRHPRSTQKRVWARDAASADIGPDSEEAVLLTAARMGHPAAFGHLVAPHTGRLGKMAFRITRNREDAEDVVQECLENAFTNIHTFRGQSRFSTWLTRIALNCSFMNLRARHRKLVRLCDSIEVLLSVRCQDLTHPSPGPEETYSREEIEKILAQEIARLEPQHQRALQLCHIEELSARDAAKVLGISKSACKSRLQRARLALRIRLKRSGIGQSSSEGRRWVGNYYCQGRGSAGSLAVNSLDPNLGD